MISDVRQLPMHPFSMSPYSLDGLMNIIGDDFIKCWTKSRSITQAGCELVVLHNSRATVAQ